MVAFTPRISDSTKELTICVTGYTGYIGRHLVEACVNANCKVLLIGRKGEAAEKIPGTIASEAWSTPSELAVQLSVFEKVVIVNIAGFVKSDFDHTELSNMLAGNFIYPIEIFECAKIAKNASVVNIGTIWEYDNKGDTKPYNLYACLKACNALAMRFFCEKYSIRAINLKLNDTYGAFDQRDKIMPYIKNSILNKKPLTVRSPKQELNLLHITDVVEGILHAAEKVVLNPSFEKIEDVALVGNKTKTIYSLINSEICKIVPNLIIETPASAGESIDVREYWHDVPRLSGWSPRIALRVGLKAYFNSSDWIE